MSFVSPIPRTSISRAATINGILFEQFQVVGVNDQQRSRAGASLLWLLAVFAASAGECPNAVAAAQPIPILLQFVRQTEASAAGALVASKAGLFAREGLSVEIQNGEDYNANPEDHSAILIRVQDARQVLLDRARGSPVVAFAGNYIDSSVAFFFRRGRQIRSPDDLLGKAIGYDPNSDSGLIFEWFLYRNPISRSSIHEMSNQPGAKQILDNTLDVLVGHVGVEDLAFQTAGIAIETLDPRQYGVHALGTVYVTDEATIDKNSDTLVRLLRALIGGWDLAYDKPDQAVAMMEAANGEPNKIRSLRSAFDQQRQFLRPGGGRFGEVPQYKWNELQSVMLQRRMLKSPVDLRRATNMTIVAEAYRGYQSRPLEK
jgi:ABC-type nitrate/sulfonate/bicarbonate transport system substrate-binding protein